MIGFGACGTLFDVSLSLAWLTNAPMPQPLTVFGCVAKAKEGFTILGWLKIICPRFEVGVTLISHHVAFITFHTAVKSETMRSPCSALSVMPDTKENGKKLGAPFITRILCIIFSSRFIYGYRLNGSVRWPHGVFVFRLCVPGSSPGWGYHIVFLGKTLNSHRSAFLCPSV